MATQAGGQLTRHEIRKNASKFAERWKGKKHEKTGLLADFGDAKRGRKLKDEKAEAQTFYNEFFEVFGVKRLGTAFFEHYVKKIGRGRGFIDLYWPKTLIAEHKSMGEDLDKAMVQANEYLPGLENNERPQFMLACDFQNFFLVDLDTRKEYRFRLHELPDRIDLFDFMRGKKPRDFSSHAPVSVKASELMGDVYGALRANGYPEQDAASLLTKLTFCFFADDTGIFKSRGLLLDYLEYSKDDGSDLGPRLIDLFGVLDTPVDGRQKNLPPELTEFPYINGDLFAGSLSVPRFDAVTRKTILKAAHFNWEGVSPSIFGTLFQSVMSAGERRGAGAHYTTEENIMKVIGPLFLDDLRVEFQKIKARKDAGGNAALEKFRKKLAGLKFFDPACGAGNFLIIAYRELRRLELEAIQTRYPPDSRTARFDSAGMPRVNVDQFHGLEINWYSAKIAETAMWMMDHLMNNEISNVYGDSYIRIPLEKKAKIVNADALETDWNDVLPSSKCSYIFGNPPFGGSKTMSEKQRAQVKKIANLGGSGGTLDYVSAWFVKATKYAPGAPLGLVAVNSITQGEQVGQLWPLLLRDGREISFAHRSFVWDSEAAGKAHVSVVVIGLAKNPSKKRLFDGGGGREKPFTYLTVFDRLRWYGAVRGRSGQPTQRTAQDGHGLPADRRRPLHIHGRRKGRLSCQGTQGDQIHAAVYRRKGFHQRRRAVDTGSPRRRAVRVGIHAEGHGSGRHSTRVQEQEQASGHQETSQDADQVDAERPAAGRIHVHTQRDVREARVRAHRVLRTPGRSEQQQHSPRARRSRHFRDFVVRDSHGLASFSRR